MANFESPALYIDFSRLPPPKVIEEVNFEELLEFYQDDLVKREPRLKSAVELEQSPTNVILQPQAFGNMILRQRVNGAARANMLPFATGSDLDNLAAFFAMNRGFDVSRLPLVESPRNVDAHPEDWEDDTRFRRRIQLAPEAFATAGSEGGYLYHALTSDVTLRDASAVRVDDRGLVRVTLMNQGSDPTPTTAQVNAVRTRLNHKGIKPLTDTVYVAPVEIVRRMIRASVTLYPGPDAAIVVNEIRTALTNLRSKVARLGVDLTRAAIVSACYREGVQNVTVDPGFSDTAVDTSQTVVITDADLTIAPLRVE
ncbi:baseplate J/gp47 family protein [uncultured Methylobacterium sp.]|uniref:baseplate assembly protein n=1 Tax=uncultured Methylobacterium sp. TaxID=157278 RepID=UPI002614619C|nr:baseplate J/gp47 family protein [uncultured Methylobacterium sp.]